MRPIVEIQMVIGFPAEKFRSFRAIYIALKRFFQRDRSCLTDFHRFTTKRYGCTIRAGCSKELLSLFVNLRARPAAGFALFVRLFEPAVEQQALRLPVFRRSLVSVSLGA